MRHSGDGDGARGAAFHHLKYLWEKCCHVLMRMEQFLPSWQYCWQYFRLLLPVVGGDGGGGGGDGVLVEDGESVRREEQMWA